MEGDISVDRLDQIRSVSVKGSQQRWDNKSMSEGRLGSMVFFFLSAGRVTILHEIGFLHIKGIKTFGYEIVIAKESEKIWKFSKK